MNKPFTPKIIRTVGDVFINHQDAATATIAGTITAHPDETYELCLAVYPNNECQISVVFWNDQHGFAGKKSVAALLPTQFGDAKHEIGIANFTKDKGDIHLFAIPRADARIVLTPLTSKTEDS